MELRLGSKGNFSIQFKLQGKAEKVLYQGLLQLFTEDSTRFVFERGKRYEHGDSENFKPM